MKIPGHQVRDLSRHRKVFIDLAWGNPTHRQGPSLALLGLQRW